MTVTPRLHAAARVDLTAIRDNVAVLRARAAGGAEVMAVVKADGYGHGLVPSARAALAGGATWLGTALLEEALALRAAGVTGPRVLAWLMGPGEAFGDAIVADVDLSASAPSGRSARSPKRPGRSASRPGAPQGRHRPVPRRLDHGRLA